ncbi:MAG: GAF domain-containing protein [Pirellulaceae bacterium]|nr:GAF domain-containing protein [Pirellulaceae bacterium]
MTEYEKGNSDGYKSLMIERPKTDYDSLLLQARGLMTGVDDLIANSANLSALIYHTLAEVNWAGFYFHRINRHNNDELILGPFQGKPACVEIPWGKGVCGTAALKKETIRVDDVQTFAGHICCDSASRSELVVPLLIEGRCFGVLDIDSPMDARFSEEDQQGIERVAALLLELSGSAIVASKG